VLSQLGPIPTETFLRSYWQKQALFIPKAISNLPIVEPDILAGYSLENSVESRIFNESPHASNRLKSQWRMDTGPFDPTFFSTLPSSHWTMLVQAQLGQSCSTNSELRTDTECKILTSFEPEQEWLTEPGDILYIPPNVAHWGIAEGECMTYSIGFRAPSYSEILLDFTQELASELPEDCRFTDKATAIRDNPGEVSPEDMITIAEKLKDLVNDPDIQM